MLGTAGGVRAPGGATCDLFERMGWDLRAGLRPAFVVLQFSGNNEAATVKLDIFGEVVVTLGTVPQGQGHETTVLRHVAPRAQGPSGSVPPSEVSP